MRADRLSLLLTYAIAGLGIAAALLHVSPPFGLLLCAFVGLGVFWDVRAFTRSHPGRSPRSPWSVSSSPWGSQSERLCGRMLAAAIMLMGGKLLAPKAAATSSR